MTVMELLEINGLIFRQQCDLSNFDQSWKDLNGIWMVLNGVE